MRAAPGAGAGADTAGAPRDAAGRRLARVLLIVNPASRRGARLMPPAVAALRRHGAACDVVPTERRGHARALAAQLGRGYDAVFTLGGDGTAMEVMDALAPDGPPLGILPAGTGNLLARALGIPLRGGAAVRALLRGHEARIDLGQLASGGRFAIGAGVGIDATMIATTPGPWKRRVGVLAYVVAGTGAVFRQRRFRARVVVDGTVLERTASAVLVANFGTLLHGLITLGPGIVADDGRLDVCVFDAAGVTDAVRIAHRMILRRFGDDAGMSYRAGRTVSVATDPALPAQADGELIGGTPFTVTVDPLAGRVLVPQRRGSRL